MSQSAIFRAAAPLDTGLRLVENTMAALGGIAISTAMVLVCTDAVMRHLFSAPLTFQFTLTESYLMVMSFALALPWGYRSGGRIRISLLLATLGDRNRDILVRGGNIVAALYLVVLGWKALEKTTSAFGNNDLVMGVIDWPVGWSWVWLPIGLFTLALRLLVDAALPIDPNADSAH
ncbi:TRAP transporter DctQ subunit (plasmid) [Octadecabacter arcticus 238]|jgi:TRAP-type C4-dicarboxylate transport system permease small subunit|uniref:TRAP transporter small permease protein n=2 Tax=Octadecabacter arcticus TaxID=53946 RepID=M9RY65_9RHOB|nr:TRAP transporter DctQ subunit [Octadecabacter arcticus 238]